MSTLTKVRRRAGKTLSALVATSGLGFARDRVYFDRAARGRARGDDVRSHVLIAPPGGGNIGDQAMVESFLENTTGPVRIVVRTAADIRVPPEHADRASLVPIPSLLYGGGAGHRVALAQLARLLDSATSVSVVGADIMDGAYSVRGSARRAEVATLARSVGVDARILGFSWNGRAHPGARRALSQAARAGTRLLLRDPLSALRAGEDGLRNIVAVADTVFSARTTSATAKRELLGDAPGPYVVVNASGYVGRSMDQVSEYATIVQSLLDSGLTVVLLPHVVRASADDSAACRAIQARVDGPAVILADRLLQPAEVRGLCADARFVLTGRMHLAIQAMWSAVPAITLSTQGKVEGLMQLFRTEALCIEPGPGLADRVIPVAGSILADRARYSDLIAARLPEVRALADANFDDLGGARRDPLRRTGLEAG